MELKVDKKVLLYRLVFIIIVLGLIVLIIRAFSYKRYNIGDFGVSISVKKDFVEQKIENYGKAEKTTILSLLNPQTGIEVNAQYRGEAFWKEDNMKNIVDEYIRLICAINYDKNIKDVSSEVKKVGSKEIGVARITVSDFQDSNSVVAVLAPKNNGYVIIQICGTTEDMKACRKEIESMVKSVKLGKNKHDYSIDTKDISGEIEAN